MSTSISISPPTADLLSQLQSSDSQHILDAASQLAIRGETHGMQAVMNVLLTTNDPAVRNGLAMIVSDQKHPAGFDALVKLLQDERTRAHRGSLLYALGAYDCSSILPLLIDFVIDGTFEVSRQAHSLISGIETEVDESTWSACAERLRGALPNADPDRHAVVAELLELFEEEP
jgi:HEAT repeat protein